MNKFTRQEILLRQVLRACCWTGLSIDRTYLDQLRDGLQQQRDKLLGWLDEFAPGLLVRDE